VSRVTGSDAGVGAGATRRRLALVLLAGFCLRLLMAPFPGGFGYDVATFQSWADTLRSRPVSQFYDHAEAADHLPGDLWVMKALVIAFDALGGGNLSGGMFTWLLKVVPAVGDVLVGLLLYLILRHLVSDTTGLKAAAWYTFNPATVFVAAVWGQWDSLSLAILLAGFFLVILGRHTWMLASMPFAWACLIKPQLVIPCAIIASLVLFRFHDAEDRTREGILRLGARMLASIMAGLAVAAAILLPFSVGLPGMSSKWSLVDRMQEALDLYPHTTLGAANVWMLNVRSLERITDETPKVLGLAPSQWGTLAFVACFVVIVVTAFRRFGPETRIPGACWAASAAVFAFFMLPTRVHERYLFPLLGLALLYALLSANNTLPTRIYWVVSVSFTLNLALVYGGFREVMPGWIAWTAGEAGFLAVSILNIVLFVAFLALPWWQRPKAVVQASPSPDAAGSPAGGG